MNRSVFLSLKAEDVRLHCEKAKVDISTIEPLPGGGVRLVCSSVEGAVQTRSRLKSKLLADNTPRHNPTSRRVVW